MNARAGVALVVLLAANSFAEETPPAPLSETREQLKSLRKDQAARKTGEVTSDLRDALPTITTPIPGQPGLEWPSTKQTKEKTEKSGAKKNWLLDRYDSLDPRKSAAMHPRDRAAAEESPTGGEEEIDPEDPEYFLKLYERQRRDAADKEMQRVEESGSLKANAAVNPFTPFMQDWLSGSPVGSIVKEAMQLNSAGESGNAPSAAGFSAGSTTLRVDAPMNTAAGNAVNPATRSAPTNPYLEALTLPTLADREPATVNMPPTTILPEPPRIDAAPPMPRATPKDDLRRALPAGADEAKKYFPQLKKF